MAAKNIKTVDIQLTLHSRLTKKSKEKNISVRKFVNDLLIKDMENDDFLKRVVPAISLIHITNEDILLRDKSAKKNNIVQITIRNGRYWCDMDNSNNCKHISYVMIIPETVKFKDKITSI